MTLIIFTHCGVFAGMRSWRTARLLEESIEMHVYKQFWCTKSVKHGLNISEMKPKYIIRYLINTSEKSNF